MNAVTEALKKTTETPAKTDLVYKGIPRILNSHASAIEKIGDFYVPKNKDEEEILAYHFKRGNIQKVDKK